MAMVVTTTWRGLDPGDEVHVRNAAGHRLRGRFVFRSHGRSATGNEFVYCWGGTRFHEKMRAFPLDRVTPA